VTRRDRIGLLVLGGLVACLLSMKRFLGSRSQQATGDEPPAPVSVARAAVRQSEFGDAWPFTVPDGVLSCVSDGKRTAVVFEAGGQRYAVNGTARGHDTAARLKLADLAAIWRDDPAIPGAKVNVGPILERAAVLPCSR
jgi:hypothetical protein